MKRLIAALAVFAAMMSFARADPKALAETKQCFSCHAVDQESKAPSFKAIAERYRFKANVQASLARKVRIGGAGHWGSAPMPSPGPRPEVSAREAQDLVEWILAQR